MIFWHGGIAIYGGLIAGAVTLHFSYYKMIAPLDFLDIAVPGVLYKPWAASNFLTKKPSVRPLSLNYLPNFIKNQMYIDNSYRTPTFLYESSGILLVLS